MSNQISYGRVQAAMRALGLEDLPHIAGIAIDQHSVTVTRTELTDGVLGTYKQEYEIDDSKDEVDDGTSLTHATVTLVHDDGVVYEFRLDRDVQYASTVSNVLVPASGGGYAEHWVPTRDSTVDLHLYGGGIARQIVGPEVVVTQPVPTGEETAHGDLPPCPTCKGTGEVEVEGYLGAAACPYCSQAPEPVKS